MLSSHRSGNRMEIKMAKVKNAQTLTEETPSGPPRLDSYIIRKLEQAKLLADPLRLRVLHAFAKAPRTTKQVADLLDEKPSRLYPHVETLLKVGLLEQKAVRQKRGAIEKYLQAIAARFEIDTTLFLEDESEADYTEQSQIAMDILDTTRTELRQSAAHFSDKALEHELNPTIIRFEMKGTPDEIKAHRQKLLEVLQDCKESSSKNKSDVMTFSGSIIFYPRPPDDKTA